MVFRLIKTIQKENPPYLPQELLSIQETRKVFIKTCQIICDITQHIADNEEMLQRLVASRSSDSDQLSELKKKEHTSVINVNKIRLPEPELVCTSNKCAEMYKVIINVFSFIVHFQNFAK